MAGYNKMSWLDTDDLATESHGRPVYHVYTSRYLLDGDSVAGKSLSSKDFRNCVADFRKDRYGIRENKLGRRRIPGWNVDRAWMLRGRRTASTSIAGRIMEEEAERAATMRDPLGHGCRQQSGCSELLSEFANETQYRYPDAPRLLSVVPTSSINLRKQTPWRWDWKAGERASQGG